jgi:hypothetical protein
MQHSWVTCVNDSHCHGGEVDSFIDRCECRSYACSITILPPCRLQWHHGLLSRGAFVEPQQFDDLTRRLSGSITRRGALKTALVTAIGGIFGLSRTQNAGASSSRCPSGTNLCNGQCVPNNPGTISCNGVCCQKAGQVCAGGSCCPVPLACGSVCCPPNQACFGNTCICPSGTSPCGSVPNVVCCPTGQACVGAGNSCPDGSVACNGCCCATSVPNATPVCVGTTCTYTCNAGRTKLNNGTCARTCGSNGDCLDTGCPCIRDTSLAHYCGNAGTSSACTTDADCNAGEFCKGSTNQCISAC